MYRNLYVFIERNKKNKDLIELDLNELFINLINIYLYKQLVKVINSIAITYQVSAPMCSPGLRLLARRPRRIPLEISWPADYLSL